MECPDDATRSLSSGGSRDLVAIRRRLQGRMLAGLGMMRSGASLFMRSALRWLLSFAGR